MKIIIAGCGKIGSALTRSLVREGHDVTVIDKKKSSVDELVNICDVRGFYGNAADPDVLLEAEVSKADLLIAATSTDELNMLSCFFAKKMGVQHTVARIRNADYNDDNLPFIKQQLGLSMAINPEYQTANTVFNLLKLPSAVKIETFSNRNLEMVDLRLKSDSSLHGLQLSEMRDRYKGNYLVCTVIRGENVFIPGGDFTLQSGDTIGVIAAPNEIPKLLKQLNLMKKQARNIMILGAGRITYYLSKKLASLGTNVKVIDKDLEKCEQLAEQLPSCAVICGDGAEQELLLQEGIRSMDAFIALTGIDEENILLSVFAGAFHTSKVICKVNREGLTEIAESLGLDCVISPEKTVTDIILRYVRALTSTAGSRIETLYQLADGKAEAVEFVVTPDFPAAGIPLKDLRLKTNILIAGIVRNRKSMIPAGKDVILPGDKVIVVSTGRTITDLTDIIK
ncbi:MAG: Trk system potassium transporter TrkA [Clostridia bacterium]|nr:Trk system potassium transporter TrkA [Clostridia bacterium]